jgi:sec-independent protein translocase protein TatC
MTHYLTYLLELRQRALRIFCVFGVIFVIAFINAPKLYTLYLNPLIHILPKGHHLIAIKITSPVLTPLSLAMSLSLLLTVPYLLYETWSFLRPALYRKEKQQLKWLMSTSLLFWILGVVFAYFLVLPYLFSFFASSIPSGVQWFPDMSDALDFMTRMLLIFGFCFQVPLISTTLVHYEFISIDTLINIRPYIIVFAFILGMLLTPPDVISQCILAIPLCLLYECGIWMSQLLLKRRKRPHAI